MGCRCVGPGIAEGAKPASFSAIAARMLSRSPMERAKRSSLHHLNQLTFWKDPGAQKDWSNGA